MAPLLLLLLLLARELAAQSSCGPGLYIRDRGQIVSHPGVGRLPYPHRLSCEWRIMAPPDRRILLLATRFAVEWAPGCGFDALQLFDGVNASAPRLGAPLCGAGEPMAQNFASSGQGMLLRFTTDASVAKTGFELRYTFLRSGEGPEPGVTTRNGTCDSKEEMRCPTVADASETICLHNAFRCDNITDCAGDKDEGCGRATGAVCGASKFECHTGKPRCIFESYKCDRYGDCEDSSDEQLCGIPSFVVMPTPQVLAAAVPTCGRSIIPQRPPQVVVGGQMANPGSWPWMVSVRLHSQHMCGGSILTPRYILSAAHCFSRGTQAFGWTVRAGLFQVDSLLPSNVQRLNVRKVQIHPQYDPRSYDFDVAILQLERPLRFNSLVLPICLAERAVPSHHVCMITGWGRTFGASIGLLKQGTVSVSTHNYCKNAYRHRKITKRMICAGTDDGSTDTCQGDSGGPLQCRQSGTANPWVVHGITSFGTACGVAGKPGVYTNVTEILPWIKENIRGS